MNNQLNYMMVRQRNAELHHAGEQARLAREMHAAGRNLPDQTPITQVTIKPGRRSPRAVTALEVERPIVRMR
jgi:hypothetical protein